jgi:rubrerythrin
MAMKGATETRNYEKSSSEVFSAISKALEDLKIRVIDKDEKAGKITAATGFSLFSTGGEISIEVKALPDGKEIAVTIEEKPKMKTVATDWGKSSRDVKRLFTKLEEHLGIEPETSKAVEKKTEVKKAKQANICPSCGQSIRATDKFCQNCGAKLSH